ncbi:MAG: thioesterase family protein [Bacteroidetes bacterium]|nr:thioesterase family protein [Bacteroidota bacterium]MDA0984646.1 thioesterase family protein [Bacteroidota bacterium]
MKVFTLTTKVLAEHIDNLGHVNNVQYLQWVQDAAFAHWEALIQNQKETLGIWVVRSHSITYKNPAFINDEITLKTYVKQSKGVLSERIVEIYKDTNSCLLARCSTQWCYLNATTHKMEKIPQSILDIFES